MMTRNSMIAHTKTQTPYSLGYYHGRQGEPHQRQEWTGGPLENYNLGYSAGYADRLRKIGRGC